MTQNPASTAERGKSADGGASHGNGSKVDRRFSVAPMMDWGER
jgi:hypothetical protein